MVPWSFGNTIADRVRECSLLPARAFGSKGETALWNTDVVVGWWDNTCNTVEMGGTVGSHATATQKLIPTCTDAAG